MHHLTEHIHHEAIVVLCAIVAIGCLAARLHVCEYSKYYSQAFGMLARLLQ
jgi:hypothetical protein